MKRKLQENKKKGFTLVELIVVLVILAILAALLIPALTGYIDKAKEKQVIAETRSCVMAAQTYADEKYGVDSGDLLDTDSIKVKGKTVQSKKAVAQLADVDGTVLNFTVDGGKVTLLRYRSASKKLCQYESDPTGTTSDGKYDIQR